MLTFISESAAIGYFQHPMLKLAHGYFNRCHQTAWLHDFSSLRVCLLRESGINLAIAPGRNAEHRPSIKLCQSNRNEFSSQQARSEKECDDYARCSNKRPEQDELGRHVFARHLATALREYKFDESLCVALYGSGVAERVPS